MKIAISVDQSDQILPLELPSDFTLLDFKAYVESETNIAQDDQIILKDGKCIDLDDDNLTIEQLGINDNDLLVLKAKSGENLLNPSASPNQSNPSNLSNESDLNLKFQIEMLRQKLIHDPAELNNFPIEIRENVNNKEEFFRIMSKIIELKNNEKVELEKLYKDPDNPENQKRILELINLNEINKNMQNALEHTPESFTQIHMLYINVQVNGHHIKAFVDSGAQTTIISPKIAQISNLSRLIDKRFISEARGVGKLKTLGKIHSAPLIIENHEFPCSFTVLETGDVEMLLGLDMLRRYRAIIDLNQDCLIMGNIKAKFLPQSECPGFGLKIDDQPILKTESEPNQLINKKPEIETRISADPMKIEQLVSMGFGREQAELALIQSNNNLELAAGLLFD